MPRKKTDAHETYNSHFRHEIAQDVQCAICSKPSHKEVFYQQEPATRSLIFTSSICQTGLFMLSSPEFYTGYEERRKFLLVLITQKYER